MEETGTVQKRVAAEIDLDRLMQNAEWLKKKLAPHTAFAAVVKADGYGHGAVPIARELDPLADWYCVATAEEALNLRSHAIGKPILILGPVPEEQYEALIQAEVRMPVFTVEEAEAMSRQAEKVGKKALAHLAVDTGMNRIGIKPSPEAVSTAKRMAESCGLLLEGAFTHLYCADERTLSSARRQCLLFQHFLEELKREGIQPEWCHVANSAAIMRGIGTDFRMVRAGIAMYGIAPSREMEGETLPLSPVMSLRSRVSYVKEIEAGEEISYGGIFRSEHSMRVATVSAGYADGYPRSLSNCGQVLIAGRRARILGRICMDQMMVDVSDNPEAKRGSAVTLLGQDGSEAITLEELSQRSGRFPYEFVCDISRRVPRVYFRKGVQVGTKDWFQDRYDSIR